MNKEFHINETVKHKQKVESYLMLISKIIEKRGREHDLSKLQNIEKEIFDIYGSKLKSCAFGSEEYKSYLKEMKPALDHHYKNNRHHPEHFEYGINDMNLIDLIEMLFDWLASSKRHKSGCIMDSIDINKSRFGIDEAIVKILKNTYLYMNSYGLECVEETYEFDDNTNVKIIVSEWMTGKSIDRDIYLKTYSEDEVYRAESIILTLCSMGLG